MDNEAFKTELLARLDKIQSLLTYLCAAAKSSEERAQAELAQKRAAAPQPDKETPERSLLQDEMQDDYNQAVQRWQSDRR